MWGISYNLDEYSAECKRQFRSLYPECHSCVIRGVSQDRTALIAEAVFFEGTFYFRLTPESISQSYCSLYDADRVWENGDPIR